MLFYPPPRQSDYRRHLRAGPKIIAVNRVLRRAHYTCVDEAAHLSYMTRLIDRLGIEVPYGDVPRFIERSGRVGVERMALGRNYNVACWINGRHRSDWGNSNHWKPLLAMQRLVNRIDVLAAELSLTPEDREQQRIEKEEMRRRKLREYNNKRHAERMEPKRREKRRRRLIDKAIRAKAVEKAKLLLPVLLPVVPAPTFHHLPTCRPRHFGTCACAGRQRLKFHTGERP